MFLLGESKFPSRHDQSEAQLRYGQWQVISLEFLQSFLRRHFAGQASDGVTKCRLFSQAIAIRTTWSVLQWIFFFFLSLLSSLLLFYLSLLSLLFLFFLSLLLLLLFYFFLYSVLIFSSFYVSPQGLFYPPHVGLPIGSSDSPKNFLLETHYDNPKLVKGLSILWTILY